MKTALSPYLYSLLLLIGVLTIFCPRAEAEVGCCDLYADAEALYWQPNHAPIFVARRQDVSSGTGPRRDITYLNGKYDWGGRGRVGLRCKCVFADAAYLRLQTRSSVSQERGDFVAMVQIGARQGLSPNLLFVESEDKYLYQNVDVRFGRTFFQCCPSNAFVYLNARWVKLDFRQDVAALGVFPTSFTQKSDFQGGGFGFGVGGCYNLCAQLGLESHVGLMAIAGGTRYDLHSVIGSPAFLISPLKWGHVLPAFDFRVALKYALNCRCSTFIGEVGYEANYYMSILHYASKNDSPSVASGKMPEANSQSIGFSGLVLRLGVVY